MADERRYQEDEIAQIFEVAASPQPARRAAAASAGGLTLSELQAIGREVGVPPERIADAAAALDRPGAISRRRGFLNMPIAVGRTVDLPRAPTDREWEILVAELRETFSAQGSENSRGNLRSWNNGNLHALIEPTETGYRLRLGTTKGNAVAANQMALGGIALAMLLVVIFALTGRLSEELVAPIILGGVSSALLAANAFRLPGWASEREAQMDRIAARAQSLLSPPPSV
jgi:hypothetical protein